MDAALVQAPMTSLVPHISAVIGVHRNSSSKQTVYLVSIYVQYLNMWKPSKKPWSSQLNIKETLRIFLVWIPKNESNVKYQDKCIWNISSAINSEYSSTNLIHISVVSNLGASCIQTKTKVYNSIQKS